MSTCNSTVDHMDTIESELGLNIQRRHSFLAPDEENPGEVYSARGEDHGSISSESTSAVSSVRPMSTTVSSTGDQSIFHLTDPTKVYNTTYVQQLPQHIVPPAGSQVYQSVIYEQQHQNGYNFNPSPIGMPTMGFAPVTVQALPMNISMPQPLHQQQVVYPVQDSRPVPQSWSHVPNTTVPYIVSPVAFPQLNLETQQASSVTSSTVSTPVVSCFSSPGYVSYGYINTPVLSSASCTPIPSSMIFPEIPPALDLEGSYAQDPGYPRRISCNINLGTVSSVPGTPVTGDATSANPGGSTPATSIKSSSLREEIENAVTTVDAKEEVNLWTGGLNYEEYQLNGGSNVFITWSGAKEALAEKLRSFKLQVREVLSTRDKNVWNVVFESHPIARKAFTMQRQIRVRIVPPKNSHRIWFRNPSPTFLVKFETKCRLTVRKGKAECHGVVGELLKGCLITADQLKGNRIRVICCEGSFVFPGGKTVEMKGVQTNSSKKTSLGWISYRSKYTNEFLVTRRSWNKLEDYVYSEQL